MKAIMVLPIIRALEARIEWLENETDNSEELPILKEALEHMNNLTV